VGARSGGGVLLYLTLVEICCKYSTGLDIIVIKKANIVVFTDK
jgi:hypothetical protein